MGEAQRRWYEKNKALCIAKAAADRAKQYEEYKAAKNNQPCTDCGVRYPWYVLQYDHRPGEGKVGNVANMVRRKGWKKVREEIAKCDLVCANCHAIRTYTRRNVVGTVGLEPTACVV